MRLSDIKGERTLDVIADVIEPICNIAEDEEASALFKREKLPDGMTVKNFLLNRVRKAVPVLLKGHKNDIITVLAAIDGISKQEYTDEMSVPKLIKDLTELLTDDIFKTFFILAQSKTGTDSSGSAQENTEGH